MKAYFLVAFACACGLMVQNATAQLTIPIDEVGATAILPAPPVVPGTVELLDPSGAISDEVIFFQGVQQIHLLSDPADELPPGLADVPVFPPPIPPVVTLTEGPNGSATYHPISPSMPGFIPGVDYQLNILSDGDLPLPSAAYAGMALLALLGLARAIRRRPLAG